MESWKTQLSILLPMREENIVGVLNELLHNEAQELVHENRADQAAVVSTGDSAETYGPW